MIMKSTLTASEFGKNLACFFSVVIKSHNWMDVVVHNHNLSTREAETGKSKIQIILGYTTGLRPVWAVWGKQEKLLGNELWKVWLGECCFLECRRVLACSASLLLIWDYSQRSLMESESDTDSERFPRPRMAEHWCEYIRKRSFTENDLTI